EGRVPPVGGGVNGRNPPRFPFSIDDGTLPPARTPELPTPELPSDGREIGLEPGVAPRFGSVPRFESVPGFENVPALGFMVLPAPFAPRIPPNSPALTRPPAGIPPT